MEVWKEYTIDDICKTIFAGGDAVKYNPTKNKTEENNIPIYANSVENEGLYGYCSKPLVTEPAVTVAARGAGTGFVCYRKYPYVPIVRLLTLIPNEDVDAHFLYYRLKKNFIKGDGSAIPQLTVPMIKKERITLPSISTQQKIAKILSSLDDKIEVNRRINEQLEELAQALFKSWFVDFEPFKDGEFVESELGMIPEGWKVETLGELCDSISKKHSFKKDKLIFLNTGDIHNNIYLHNNYMLVKDMPGQAKKTIEKGDILYSEIRPVNRHFALVNFDSTDYVVSTKLMVIRSRNINNLRLFQYLTSKDVVDFLQQEAETRSGTFPQIRFENIQRLKMIIASNDVETKYASLLSSIYSSMENNNKEITHLTNLRDTLLPKLMAGDIDVN